MRRLHVAASFLAALAGACGSGPSGEPRKKDLGGQTADVAMDTRALEAANAAAAPVVRAAGDCDAVRVALPEAQQKLDAIAPQVRTATGRVTFDAVRKRVREIDDMCP